MNEFLNIITMIGFAVLGYLVLAAKAAVKTSAEEGAKAAVRELTWPAEFARELKKTRGIERQEFRYRSYGQLWKELRLLALYDDTGLDKKAVSDLSKKLSDWYFSVSGGLLLTSQARHFYFALQKLLHTTATMDGAWKALRSDRDHKTLFRALLKDGYSDLLLVLDELDKEDYENWNKNAIDLGNSWKNGIEKIAKQWNALAEEMRFTVLQQVGSTLRTSLVIDLESRLL